VAEVRLKGLNLLPFQATGWTFTGTAINHLTEIEAKNCIPTKLVVDQIVNITVSECKTLRTCPPFIKEYHVFGFGLALKEVILGVGLGCEILNANLKMTRRSQWTDAENYIKSASAIADIKTAFERLAAGHESGWVMDAGQYYGGSVACNKACPSPALNVLEQ